MGRVGQPFARNDGAGLAGHGWARQRSHETRLVASVRVSANVAAETGGLEQHSQKQDLSCRNKIPNHSRRVQRNERRAADRRARRDRRGQV